MGLTKGLTKGFNLGALLNYDPLTDSALSFRSTSRSGLSLVDEFGHNPTIIPAVAQLNTSGNTYLTITPALTLQNGEIIIHAAQPTPLAAGGLVFGGGGNSSVRIKTSNTITVAIAGYAANFICDNISFTDLNIIRLVLSGDGRYMNLYCNGIESSSGQKDTLTTRTFTIDAIGALNGLCQIAYVEVINAGTTTFKTHLTGNTLYEYDESASAKRITYSAPPQRVYKSYASQYCLNSGFSIYERTNYNDEYVPYGGSAAYIISQGYTLKSVHAGSESAYNLAPSVIDFATSEIATFDKSNTDHHIPTSYLKYYDPAFPFRWRNDEIGDWIVYRTYFTFAHNYQLFAKITKSTSVLNAIRPVLISEILAYSSKKTPTQIGVIILYCGIVDSPPLVYRALGTTTGTPSEIMMSPKILAGNASTEIVASEKPAVPTNPNDNYIVMLWADFFTEDRNIVLPLYEKYGFTGTFCRQIKPLTANPLSTSYDRERLKMIERSGSYDADHTILHIVYTFSCPLYDGRITPTNDDLRVERADGTNEWGHDVDLTVDATLGTTLRDSWLNLSADIGATAWKNLTDADCLAIRKSVGIFGMPLDGATDQKVLEMLDFLSERYCGTTGISVDNYITRTPNTLGGVDPDPDHRILGGIFQGASSTQNHEIWERALIIIEAYKREFEGLTKAQITWGYPGGMGVGLLYKEVFPESIYGRYLDKEHTILSSGFAEFTSSINGNSRSFSDLLISLGYKFSLGSGGTVYADYPYDYISLSERQRLFQKNAFVSKPNEIGWNNSKTLRVFDDTLSSTEQNTLVGESDIVKAFYDFTATTARYSSITAYANANFSAVIKQIAKLLAWGQIPFISVDSGIFDGSATKKASTALAYEALMQFCLRNGIKCISAEEAIDLCFNKQLTITNYFPNPTLKRIIYDTIPTSENIPSNPDGWDNGVIESGTVNGETVNILYVDNSVGGTELRTFIRLYALKIGTASVSFYAKGKGSMKVRVIKNSNTYTDSIFSTQIISTVLIDSEADYALHTGSFNIIDADLETYSEPTTPTEIQYQQYMKRLGDKWCGLQIELAVDANKTMRFALPDLAIN